MPVDDQVLARLASLASEADGIRRELAQRRRVAETRRWHDPHIEALEVRLVEREREWHRLVRLAASREAGS